MKLMLLLQSLRSGTTLPHAKQWRWFGVVLVCGVIALKGAQVWLGIGNDISDTEVLELVTLIAAIYMQVASSPTLGVASKSEELPDDESRAEQ